MSFNMEQIVLDSIAQYAEIKTKVSSIELEMAGLRAENEKILARITETLEKMSVIAEKVSRNTDDHQVIHARINDVKEELDEVSEEMHTVQLRCQGTDHADLLNRVKHIESCVSKFSFVGYKIFKIPVWVMLLTMIIFSSLGTVYYDMPWMITVVGNILQKWSSP